MNVVDLDAENSLFSLSEMLIRTPQEASGQL